MIMVYVKCSSAAVWDPGALQPTSLELEGGCREGQEEVQQVRFEW